MIQVSTPIQSQSSSALAPEPDSSRIESPGEAKSRKKNAAGGFSKLLESLLGKSKKGNAGQSNHVTHNGEELKSRSRAKKASFIEKKEWNSPLGENSLEVLTLLLQNEAKTGVNPEINTENSDFPLQEPGEPLLKSAKADNLSRGTGIFSSLDSIPSDSAPQEAEVPPSAGLQRGENEPPSPSALSEEAVPGEKTNGNKGAVDLFQASARNFESRPYQFAGTPRPGLVDSLSGADAGGETRNSRLAEGRKRGRDRFSLERRDAAAGEAREQGSRETIKPALFGNSGTGKADMELTADLHAGGKGREGDAGNSGAFKGTGLEDALARELKETLGSDIVKQASILVRNQQEGTIRLTLKPESLGNVKIRLEMAENKITGHIVVESTEALRAFERELPVLEKAFRDSGFSETSLDMSMAQDGGAYNRESGYEGGDFKHFAPALAASRYDDGMTEREILPKGFSPETSGRKAVNMLI